MCCSTKEKIASVLRQLSTQRPLQKITVQNLMDAANMKRQSFYYHFKDIHDVLLWIYQKEIITPLLNSDLPFDRWIVHFFSLLDMDRSFYRKAFGSMQQGSLFEVSRKLFVSRISAVLYNTDDYETLSEPQHFVVEVFTRALISHAEAFLNTRRAFDEDKVLENVRCLLATIGRPVAESDALLY